MSGPWRLREAGLRYAPPFVVDASVALATAVEEPWSGAAQALFEHAGHEALALLVPDLFWYEVANALRYRLATDRAGLLRNFGAMIAAPLATLPLAPAELADVAAMALDEDLTVYDAAYLFLAQRIGCSLITEDKRLLAAAGGRYSRSLREIGL